VSDDGSPLLGIDPHHFDDLVARRRMKREDRQLIPAVTAQLLGSERSPGSRDALFYPSAGKDIFTPTILGLPYCTQFFFYERNERIGVPPGRAFADALATRVDISRSAQGRLLEFDYEGIARSISVVHSDNFKFLERDVDLAFYFHRGDSPGEGGSGQEWDSEYLADLGRMVPEGRDCRIVTQGEPGGVRPDVQEQLHRLSIPDSHGDLDYFVGTLDGAVLRRREGS